MAGDFDVEFDSWRVSHRRLRQRLVSCTDEHAFSGTADVQPVAGGTRNIEDNVLDMRQRSLRAIAIRLFA